MNFILNTLPKQVLIALVYRLFILQMASRILPTIGADSWTPDESADNTWDDRPASTGFSSFVSLYSPLDRHPTLRMSF